MSAACTTSGRGSSAPDEETSNEPRPNFSGLCDLEPDPPKHDALTIENATKKRLSELCNKPENELLKDVVYEIVPEERDVGDCEISGANFTLFGASGEGIHVNGNLHLKGAHNIVIKGLTFSEGPLGMRLKVEANGDNISLIDNNIPSAGPPKPKGASLEDQEKICSPLEEEPGAPCDDTPTAIRVEASAQVDRVLIKGNKLKDIVACKTSDDDDSQAHGIHVVASKSGKITNLRVERNVIKNADTGHSEVISLNGDIQGFLVAENSVRFYNNIGIDVMGKESQGAGVPERGVVRHNLVVDWRRSKSNSEPGFGIYSDGTNSTCISRNVVFSTYEGLEISAEHAGRFSGNVMEENIVAFPCVRGLRIGTSSSGALLQETWSMNNWLIQESATYSIENDDGGEVLGVHIDGDNVLCYANSSQTTWNPVKADESGIHYHNCNNAKATVPAPEWVQGVSPTMDPCELFANIKGDKVRPEGCPKSGESSSPAGQ